MSETKKGLGLGITVETKDSNSIPFLTPVKLDKPTNQFPSGYKFPIGRLVNVVANPKYETKNGDKSILMFLIKDKENRSHTHIEWAIDLDDDKFQQKVEAMNVRIKHLFTALVGKEHFPKEGIGTTAQTFDELFKEVADVFNAHKELYSQPAYFKLVYYNGNANFPYSPNFVEKFKENKPCSLTINPKYDKIENDAKPSQNLDSLMGEDVAGDDVPDFTSAFS